MRIIKAIELDRLRNGEYIQMGADTKAITGGMAATVPEIAPFANDFNSKMAAINGVFMLDPASPLSIAIELADVRRDNAIIGLTFVAQGYTYSTIEAKKAAGDALYRGITIYGSGIVNTVARQSYVAESASITNLLIDFINQPPLADAITTLGLSDWVTELTLANNDFKEKYQQRTDAYGDASPDTVRSLRVAADAAFKKLREKVAAYYSINDGAAPWSTLVSRLNAMIDQYNTLIASHPPGPSHTPPQP